MRDMNSIPMEMRPKVRFWVPAAAMDEEDLRLEIRNLYERGFGGIEVVVLQMVPPQILQSDDGWGTPAWDRMIDVMNDETGKLGMSMDLAAGPGWPLASPALAGADSPGILWEMTYGSLTLEGGTHYAGPLPERRKKHDEGEPVLAAVMGYRLDCSDPELAAQAGTVEKLPFGERENRLPLVFDSYVDLSPNVRTTDCGEAEVTWDVPGSKEQQWVLFAFWEQPAIQKINARQTYVIDHYSAAGAKAMADYWEPLLSAHRYDALESLFCDSLEFEVSMDWTPNLFAEFRARRYYDLTPYLPFLGEPRTYPAPDAPAYASVPAHYAEQINNDYKEVLTQLYCEEHLAKLEKMAERFGKTIRYQVAYNKPIEEERCGLYVGIPENEALGRQQLDGQRLMAGAAHLGRKKRYSFECAAEFMHDYGQGYEDLMWWVKRSLISGMNAQVLHGASYSGRCTGNHPDNLLNTMGVWPGYDGFARYVSNEWNRTPDRAHARGVLDAVSRLNMVFRGHARIDCAVFRQSYLNDGIGPEFLNYPDDGALQNAGYSYDFVSEHLLDLPAADVSEAQLDRPGAGYRALVVPPQERMSEHAMGRILALAAHGLPVILVGPAPKEAMYFFECRTEAGARAWLDKRDWLWYSPAENVMRVADLSEVPTALSACGVRPRVAVSGGTDIATAFRRDPDNGCTWAVLYGYNRIREGQMLGPGTADMHTVKPLYERPGASSSREVEVTIHSYGKVYAFDYWNGTYAPLDFVYAGKGRMRGFVRIEEDEMVVLCIDSNEMPTGESEEPSAAAALRTAGTVEIRELALYSFEPDTPDEKSFLRSGFQTEPVYCRTFDGPQELTAWRHMDPSLEFFSGKGVYRGALVLDRAPEDRERVILEAGDVYDTFAVRINGAEAPFADQVTKRADLTGLVHEGENALEITVVSELHNRLLGPMSNNKPVEGMPAAPYIARDYGMVPKEDKPLRICLLTNPEI